ncbi:MAG: 1-acyl-sn-glycerol-3-phosphate acyltransferase, partial [Desulfohalobiaceae bacterium]
MPDPKPLVPSDLPSLKEGYTTPPGRGGALARLSPGLAFYPRMLLTVLQAARMARKGRYGKQEW